jgi:Tfp pilus assembly protein PilX
MITLRTFKKSMHSISPQKARGFTLLLASLISSLLLILGSAIFVLVQKQIILSSLGRDSQFAFYAADQAAECAMGPLVRPPPSRPLPATVSQSARSLSGESEFQVHFNMN